MISFYSFRGARSVSAAAKICKCNTTYFVIFKLRFLYGNVCFVFVSNVYVRHLSNADSYFKNVFALKQYHYFV